MSTQSTNPEPEFLTGQILIAMPGMTDPRFTHALVYLCAHSDEGAMGLIINKKTDQLIWRDLFERLDVPLGGPNQKRPVRYGGPVETQRGFVLHSTDYHAPEATMRIDAATSMTASSDVLDAIGHGRGPSDVLIALGYAGWGPGQLEAELRQNGWLLCAPDRTLVFDEQDDPKWAAALAKLGIDPALLSAGGHA